MKIVVMGVSGSGKSTIGELLADDLNIPFLDGDDFHPPANVDKMSKGVGLTDTDRVPWLERLSDVINESDNVILACSALKPEYRRLLLVGNPNLQFIFLNASTELILKRIESRKAHFFKGQSLVTSQFDALAPPSSREALIIDASLPANEIINQVKAQLPRTKVGEE